MSHQRLTPLETWISKKSEKAFCTKVFTNYDWYTIWHSHTCFNPHPVELLTSISTWRNTPLLTAEEVFFFGGLSLKFLPPINIWKICIDLRLFSKFLSFYCSSKTYSYISQELNCNVATICFMSRDQDNHDSMISLEF